MEQTGLPLPPEIWAAPPRAALALLLDQRERIRELEARLGQTSSNSSRPPSSDPPHGLRRPKASPTGRKRGDQQQAGVQHDATDGEVGGPRIPARRGARLGR
jgi:hypothetical protein